MEKMENERTFETIVGVLVLAVTVFFFHYVYTKSGWQIADGYTLTAKFDRADGLTEGTDVKISGIRVGKIISTDVDAQTFLAVVKFTIPRKIELPKDTIANVASDGLLGSKYLSLTPGGEEESLKNGDEVERTNGPINLESLIGKAMFSQDKDKQDKKAKQ
jgi:phospholipid/cholesterol/gamma-HCH transport system substrate-binding protein